MDNKKLPSGLLLIDKPLGWTSHDVVAKVRNTLRAATSKQPAENNGKKPAFNSPSKVKVGHTGTLDPLASGLMILVVGSYCKRASEFSKLNKTYEVAIQLGENSSTGDMEGEKTKISDKIPSIKEVKEALGKFVGQIQQTPPAHSAIKIRGVRSYKLARQGKEVKLQPRQVTIHKLKLTGYTYPKAEFTATVSSGTYIRTLAEDIGEKLGTGAFVSDLRRVAVGTFDVKNALAPRHNRRGGVLVLDKLSAQDIRDRLLRL